MKIPPTLESPTQYLQQKVSAEAQRLAHASELKVGRVLAALVTEVSELSEVERQQALRKLQQQIGALKVSAETVDAKSQLAEWQTAPKLNLVGLRTGGRQLYSLTPATLQAQQMVKVIVRQDGQLQLLNDQLSGKTGQQATVSAEGLEAGRLQDKALQMATRQGAISPTQVDLLAQGLRAHLPQQTSIKSLMQLLGQLHEGLESLPAGVRDKAIPPEVLRALTAVRDQSFTARQLSEPQGLRQALQQNGVFFEGNLAQWAKNQVQPQESPIAKELVSKHGGGDASPTQRATPPLADADLKAALLQALHTLQQLQPMSMAQATSKPSSGSESLIFTLLGLLQKTPTREKSFADSRNQLLKAIQQQLTSALAKIQTQQLQTVNQRLGEGAAPSQGGYFEIPVRLPDGYSSIGIQIHEYRIDDSSEDTNQSNKTPTSEKTQLWEVFMEFDLASYGQLTSQLKVMNGAVSANFWADTAHTRALAQDQLKDLRGEMEANGLQVKDIQCLPGPPPQRKLKLNYNLVDITT